MDVDRADEMIRQLAFGLLCFRMSTGKSVAALGYGKATLWTRSSIMDLSDWPIYVSPPRWTTSLGISTLFL